jgi:hypothetical protein
MSDKKQRSATQRIEDLETGLMSLYQTADNMARDLLMVKDAIKLLGNKVDALVKAAERGTVNDAVVAAIMVENNVEELKKKVDTLVAQGILASEEKVTQTSFVVGREIDSDGKVVNPRLQFTMGALQPEIREKILGGMPGQVITLQEDKLKFEVLETYAIQTPKAPEAEAPSEAPAEQSQAAEAAPATESEAANS